MFILFSVLIVLLVAAGALQLARQRSVRAISPDDWCWFENFSVSSYRALPRLADLEDLRFLQEQPGYRPEIGRRFRQERNRLFRLQLASLAADCEKLQAIVAWRMAGSQLRDETLATDLLQLHWAFRWQLTRVRLQLMLPGFEMRQVDTAALLSAFCQFATCTQRLIAPLQLIEEIN